MAKKIEKISLVTPVNDPHKPKVIHPTLRFASIEDIPQLQSLAMSLVKDSPIEKIGVSPTKAVEQLTKFILNTGQDFLCLVSYDEDKVVGVLAAYAFEPVFSEERVACEVLWYLLPEYRKGRRGLEMMQAYEYWAKMVGCKVAQYGWLVNSPEGMKSLYERTGAVKSEEVYYKELV